jgi:histidinol-phosphatase
MDVIKAVALARDLADLADDITMSRFRASDLQVSTKPDLTPVSEADQAVERALRDALKEYADHAVHGEEYDDHVPEGSEYRWIIDPIDGTKNYVRGVPIWATCIGLERSRKLIAGCVSAPALGMRWWAGKGIGAFRNGDRINVSHVSSLADAHLSFSWGSKDRFERDGMGEKLLALSGRSWRTRNVGDFWQHVLVAEGAFDIAIDPIVSLWDVAAIVPIVEEAGGRWSTRDGRADANGGSFVCTNGALHDEVIAALA